MRADAAGLLAALPLSTGPLPAPLTSGHARAALASSRALVPLTAGQALTWWQFAPLVSGAATVLAGGYLAAAHQVRRRHPARPWPAGRTASFLAGLAVIAAATQSSIAGYDGVLFSAHMVQHLLLIMVAPPLLVFGRPVTLVMHAARNPVHSWVKRAVQSRLVTALTWPPGVVLLYAVVVAGTHTPPVMDLVVRNGAAHDGEHALYIVSGYLYFLVIAGSEPVRWRVSMPARYLMLLAAMQVDTVVGMVLMVAGHELFPVYAGQARGWGPAPVADLHTGGVIMFAGSDIVMTLLALAVSVSFIHGPRHAGRLGGWAEGIRRAVMLRNLSTAGVAPPALRPGRTVDDDAYLTAYNAYLSSLHPPDQPQALP